MSFLKTAEACLERGFHNKTLNAFIITKDHGIIRVAASAADERVNTGILE